MQIRTSRMIFKIILVGVLGLGIAVVGSLPPAGAGLILQLDDPDSPGIDVSLVDSAGTGVITYFGAVGAFNINVTTAVSKPNIGNEFYAQLDLNSINVSSTSGGTIIIRASDDSFSVVPLDGIATLQGIIGGTTGGTVTYQQYADLSNTLLGMSGPGVYTIGAQTYGPGAFSGGGSLVFPYSGGNFSITDVVTITHSGAGQSSSFNVDGGVITPEPTSLLLLGSGLAGLGLLGRKKSKARRGQDLEIS